MRCKCRGDRTTLRVAMLPFSVFVLYFLFHIQVKFRKSGRSGMGAKSKGGIDNPDLLHFLLSYIAII
jgi:hypothetical protein